MVQGSKTRKTRERSWRRWLGYGIPAALTAAVTAGVLLHALDARHQAAWITPVELGSTGILAALLVGGLLRFRARDYPPTAVLRMGLWTLGGTLFVGVTILAIVQGQTAAGGRISEPAVTVAITSLAGGLAGFLVGFYDVDRRSAVEEKERLARQLGFVNQTLRHDVRNDAAVIAGNAALLRGRGQTSEELEQIEQAAEHVVELTHLARAFDRAQQPVEVEPTPLVPMLERAVGHARRAFPNAEITLDADAIEGVTVGADELLASVFENLLRNAVQHHDRKDPHVEVRGEATDGAVRVRVADDGPGIPERVRDRLFEEGIKGLGSTGSGLGLYLVRELTEAYGGRVEVDDRRPRGTVFTIELPRV